PEDGEESDDPGDDRDDARDLPSVDHEPGEHDLPTLRGSGLGRQGVALVFWATPASALGQAGEEVEHEDDAHDEEADGPPVPGGWPFEAVVGEHDPEPH